MLSDLKENILFSLLTVEGIMMENGNFALGTLICEEQVSLSKKPSYSSQIFCLYGFYDEYNN